MSAGTISTHRLEPALRLLAEDDDVKVAVAAAKHLPAGVKLGDFCAEIWAWLKEHNAGKRSLSSTRINGALAKAPEVKASSPGAKERIQGAMERTIVRRRPRLPHVTTDVLADSAPNTSPVEVFDKDNGSSPWTKRPRRPRVTAVAHWRTRLVAIANWDKSGLEGPSGGAWWSCKRKWFGTATPAPSMVERFLAWFDAGEETAKAAPFKFPVRVVKTPVGRLGQAARAQAAATTPPPAPADGWTEIAPACGGHADYDARFTGNETKTKRLGFTKRASSRLAARGFAIGKFVRVHWNGQTRQLALSLADQGFKIRTGRDALAIAGAALVPMLGENAIEFTEAPAVSGFDLVLSAKPASHET